METKVTNVIRNTSDSDDSVSYDFSSVKRAKNLEMRNQVRKNIRNYLFGFLFLGACIAAAVIIPPMLSSYDLNDRAVFSLKTGVYHEQFQVELQNYLEADSDAYSLTAAGSKSVLFTYDSDALNNEIVSLANAIQFGSDVASSRLVSMVESFVFPTSVNGVIMLNTVCPPDNGNGLCNNRTPLEGCPAGYTGEQCNIYVQNDVVPGNDNNYYGGINDPVFVENPDNDVDDDNGAEDGIVDEDVDGEDDPVVDDNIDDDPDNADEEVTEEDSPVDETNEETIEEDVSEETTDAPVEENEDEGIEDSGNDDTFVQDADSANSTDETSGNDNLFDENEEEEDIVL
jgi:hypothetical protein